MISSIVSILFVGTGASSGTPVLGHVGRGCTCYRAIQSPLSKDHRNNVSIILCVGKRLPKVRNEAFSNRVISNTDDKFVLIDCGKTFRDAYFRTLFQRKINHIDALLITHHHADAINGIDDLRDLQPTYSISSSMKTLIKPIETYLTKATYDVMRMSFPYILENGRFVDNFPTCQNEWEAMDFRRSQMIIPPNPRHCTSLDTFLLSDQRVERIYIEAMDDIPIFSFPVEHGSDLISLGFAFGHGIHFKKPSSGYEHLVNSCSWFSTDESAKTSEQGLCVVYISDISKLLPISKLFLSSVAVIDILIIDCLYTHRKSHFSHFCLDQVLEFMEEFQPITTYCVGMSCKLSHEEHNDALSSSFEERKKDGRFGVSMKSLLTAYDGLFIDA